MRQSGLSFITLVGSDGEWTGELPRTQIAVGGGFTLRVVEVRVTVMPESFMGFNKPVLSMRYEVTPPDGADWSADDRAGAAANGKWDFQAVDDVGTEYEAQSGATGFKGEGFRIFDSDLDFEPAVFRDATQIVLHFFGADRSGPPVHTVVARLPDGFRNLVPPDTDWEPEWLMRGLITGELPWDRAHSTTLDRTLERFRAHSCFWYGLWMKPDEGLVCVLTVAPNVGLRWEGAMDDDGLLYPLFLVIRVPLVYRIDPILSHAPNSSMGQAGTLSLWPQSRKLSQDEARQELWQQDVRPVDELLDHVWATTFRDADGHTMRLLHGSQASALLFGNHGGEPVPVPGI